MYYTITFLHFDKTVLLHYDREKVNKESCCYAIEIESTIQLTLALNLVFRKKITRKIDYHY